MLDVSGGDLVLADRRVPLPALIAIVAIDAAINPYTAYMKCLVAAVHVCRCFCGALPVGTPEQHGSHRGGHAVSCALKTRATAEMLRVASDHRHTSQSLRLRSDEMDIDVVLPLCIRGAPTAARWRAPLALKRYRGSDPARLPRCICLQQTEK